MKRNGLEVEEVGISRESFQPCDPEEGCIEDSITDDNQQCVESLNILYNKVHIQEEESKDLLKIMESRVRVDNVLHHRHH